MSIQLFKKMGGIINSNALRESPGLSLWVVRCVWHTEEKALFSDCSLLGEAVKHSCLWVITALD